ncbi:MAG: hypothetical protein WC620_10625 [Methanoregula sp.]|jgi:hypothetical protein
MVDQTTLTNLVLVYLTVIVIMYGAWPIITDERTSVAKFKNWFILGSIGVALVFTLVFDVLLHLS